MVPMERAVPGNYAAKPPAGKGSAADHLTLMAVLVMVRRQIALVLGITAIVFAVATYFARQQAPVTYRANALIRIADARRAITGRFEDATAERRATDPLHSQIQILRSRSVAGSVVDTLGLQLQPRSPGIHAGLLTDVEVARRAPFDTIRLQFSSRGVVAQSRNQAEVQASYGTPLVLEGVRFTIVQPPSADTAVLVVVPREAAITDLLANLRAVPRDQTDIIDVSFTAPDPVIAQRVVNGVVQTLHALSASTAREQSRRRREFLQGQLAQSDSLLAVVQQRLSEFRGQQLVYSSRDKLSAQQAGLLSLEVRREELQADRRMYLSLLDGLQQSSGAARAEQLRALVSSPGVASNTVVSQLYGQLVQYETERESLTTGSWASSGTHPDVERLNTLIDSTEAKLVSAIRSHVGSLEARIAALGNLEARTAGSIQTLSQREAEEVRLVQQVETTRRLGDQLREEYQRARIAEAVEVGQVEIVDLAAFAYPVIPPARRSFKMGFGLVFGLMLGGGIGFLREMINSSIRRRQEVTETLGIPELALIPRINPAGSAKQYPVRWIAGRKDTTASKDSAAVHLHSNAAGSEAYRVLRTNLLLMRDAASVRVVAVTSASPAEGKTTTAANLAIAFAQQGIRTLLVDADLRRPKLHNVLGLPQSPGLVHLLRQGCPLQQAVRTTPIADLFLLPSGGTPPNPAELVGGTAMKELMSRFTDAFDLVLLDTPPLLAASETSVLATRVDGVLLVVRAGTTQRAAGVQAMHQLSMIGARVVGAVLNDPDARVARHERYHYSYQYYAARA